MENKDQIVRYIKDNPVAVLGTTDKHNKVHGAAIYICALAADKIYFVTKVETQKYKNIQENHHVAVTIVNPTENSSLQVQGQAEAVEDIAVIDVVMSKMATIYAQGADWLPPITKIRAGAYQVVGIEVTDARLAHYKNFRPGDKRIFKEL